MDEALARPDFLPPAFGTVGYPEFVEIQVPAPAPYRPETAGWYVVFAVLAAALAWGVARGVRRYRHNAYRREALRELAELRARARGGERTAAVEALPGLLKRCALSAYGREAVARLSGDAWLAFLDRTATGALDDGAQQGLRVLSAHAASEVPTTQDAALFAGVERWMRRHRA